MGKLAVRRLDALTNSLFMLVMHHDMTIEQINELLANDTLLKGSELALKVERRPWKAAV